VLNLALVDNGAET